jgi:hypothetical protein
MNDLSHDIIQLKKLLNQLEILNANPGMIGKKLITDAVEEIKVAVIRLEIQVANYAD